MTAETFLRFSTENYRPRSASPVIDAGLKSDWMEGATDFRGNPRIRGKAPDIGAYEGRRIGAAIIFR